MTDKYDAIIVGGGHNGLTCGAYLSKAGLKTLVIERRDILGGAAVTEEFSPGFSASSYSFIMGHLHPKVIKDLELEKFGLSRVVVDNVINPTEDGDCIVFSKDPKKTQAQIARFSQKDAENYPKFFASMQNAIDLLRRLQFEVPVDPVKRDIKSLIKAGKFGWKYRDVSDEIYDIIDGLSLSAHDYVDRWFETPVVKAKFMYWATIGGNVGPYSPGTAFYLIAHLIGQLGMSFPIGGMGAISNAIHASGKTAGLETRVSAPVEKILVRDGRAYGVRLESGEEIHARCVVTNVNAKIAFGQMVDKEHLPEEIVGRISRYRTRGKSFKILCATDSLPEYASFSQEKTGVDYPAYAHIGPTPEYLERAFDDAKYGWYSKKPFLSAIVPTYYDKTLAPEGKHVVSLYGGVAPFELEGGSWDKERKNLVRNAFDVMDEYAPGFSDTVLDYKLILPKDIEEVVNMPGGNTLHGEMTLDQLFFGRPVPGLADYRSPITGLYQCGASSHPGGAVSAVPGHNAAREILKDWKRL
ncbi:MAG: NAD(P)/FAD-dependent oxidoreductase [Alphaproteobacteria bacterium]|nr:MAG: NAD(P)/FAD-dependent oxidoreductase [Alphaproteobacteria bacterium]